MAKLKFLFLSRIGMAAASKSAVISILSLNFKGVAVDILQHAANIIKEELIS